MRPRRDRQGRPHPRRGPAGGARRRDDALPRQLARLGRRAAHARGARPDGAAAPADERGAGPRRVAARHLVARPSLEDVYLELTVATRDEPIGGRAMSDAALAWRQYRLERRMFWRNPTAAFFSFVLPLIFLALFGAIFSGDREQLEVIVPGIAGPQRDGDDLQRARQPDDVPARAGRPQADPRHAAARQRIPRGRARQRGDQRDRPDPDRRARLEAGVRPRLAEGLGSSWRCSRCSA